jgi:hypothetical protein
MPAGLAPVADMPQAPGKPLGTGLRRGINKALRLAMLWIAAYLTL